MLELKGKKVLVVGWKVRHGSGAVSAPSRRKVTVSDVRSASRWPRRFRRCWKRASGRGRRPRPAPFRRQDLIVVSPGVPLDTPELAQSQALGLR